MGLSLTHTKFIGVKFMTSTENTAKRSRQIKLLVLTGLFTAIIYVLTAYLHVPTIKGYVHIGDGIIFLAASILPAPYAVFAGAIGGALADGLTGFYIWMPATIIIKALTALFFTNKKATIINVRNILGIVPSLILCVVGYSLYEGIFMTEKLSWGAITAGFVQTPFYCIQIAVSSVLYIAVGIALDKIGIKKRFDL